MTKPADAPEAADNSPPREGDTGEVLDSFKTGADGADNESVHDAIGGRPRLSWNPVTDGGGRAPSESAEERSGVIGRNRGLGSLCGRKRGQAQGARRRESVSHVDPRSVDEGRPRQRIENTRKHAEAVR